MTHNRILRRIVLVGATLLLATAFVAVQPAYAASIVVTSDVDNTNLATLALNSTCDLREAIQAALTDAVVGQCDGTAGGLDTITFDANYIITVAGPLPNITSGNITITGNGAANTEINGNNAYRIFNVNGGTLTLNNLTLEDAQVTGNTPLGANSGYGAAINIRSGSLYINDSEVNNNTNTGVSSNNDGGAIGIIGGSSVTLEIRRTTFDSNTTCDDGGAIHSRNSPTITIEDSTFSNNDSGIGCTGDTPGGAIASSGGTYTIRRTTFNNNNSGSGSGGGGVRTDGGTVNIYNSTFNGNTAGSDGGGAILVDSGTVNVYNSTIVGNTGSSGGGGLDRNSGTLALINTIVGANSCVGTVTTNANNLFVNGNGCPVGASDDNTPANDGALLLGALASNGGNTQTMLPAFNSPAVNAGANGTCQSIDQRSFARALTVADPCDIGSVEVQSYTLTVDGLGTGTGTTAGTAPSTISCTSTAGADAGTCSEAVLDGGSVVLTATAAAGSIFAGWTGCDSEAANVCTQTLGGNETVQPTFTSTTDPSLDKVFSPATISIGDISTLTFTITNPNTFALTGLAFTDTFPAAVEVAAVPNASTTCGAGTVTAVAGTGVVSLSGGTLGAGPATTCTVSVDVTATANGAHLNTSDNVGSTETGAGSDNATATLTVADAAVPPTTTTETTDGGGGGPAPAPGNLKIDCTSSASTVAPGNSGSFTCTITNDGGVSTGPVTFTGALSGGIQVTGVTTTSGTVTDDSAPDIAVDIPDVPAGGMVIISINVIFGEGAAELSSNGMLASVALQQAGDQLCLTGKVGSVSDTACVTMFPVELPNTGGAETTQRVTLIASLVALFTVLVGGSWALIRRRQMA